MSLPRILARLGDVEGNVGKQIDLVQDEQFDFAKMEGYFKGLSSPSVTLSITIFAASPRS